MNARFELGLASTGPEALHLPIGKPTPWSEGIVVRFFPDVSLEWVGNLQEGWGYARQILVWEEAKAVIVIAKGATYFVRPESPVTWCLLDTLGISSMLALDQSLALIATYTDVLAVSNQGTLLWRRTLAVDGVIFTDVGNDIICGDACIDPPQIWEPFALRLTDGLDAPLPRL